MMAKVTVTWPDVERLVVDYLTPLVAELPGSPTVAVGIPSDWRGDTHPPHVDVAADFVTPGIATVVATIRLRCRAASTSDAKALAARAAGILGAHPGAGQPGTISGARALTGPIAARDDDTRAELASTTVRVVARSLIPDDA
jgi:hypothetical protein